MASLNVLALGRGEVTSALGKQDKKAAKEKKPRPTVSARAGPTDEETALAEELFGRPEAKVLAVGGDKEDDDNDGVQWIVDTAPASKRKRGRKTTAAWVDEDDSGETVNLAGGKARLRKLRDSAAPEHASVSGEAFEEKLRSRFSQSQAKHQSAWAALPAEDEEADDKDAAAMSKLLGSTKPLKRAGGKGPLPAGELDVLRCKDANAAEPSRGVVRAVAFHPRGEVLLTAGMDKTLRFYQIDGTRNGKLGGLFFDDLPITAAAWTNGGDKVVVSGRRPFYYVYDAQHGVATKVRGLAGRSDKSLEKLSVSPDGFATAFTLVDGWVGVVDNRTNRLALEFKMNGTSRSLAWSPDSRCLLGSGGDAEVYTWDLRSVSAGAGAVRKWSNEGGQPTCGLAVAPGGGTVAVASESGVVNLYSMGAAGFPGPANSVRPAPAKRLLNLTTPVECLTYSHDGSMLAMTSRWSKSAVRVVHTASGTVFSNWPTSKSPLNYVFSCDFSPSSGFLALGNDKGKVLLYRLKHFS